MLNSGHRCLHGRGQFHQGLHGGILRLHEHGDNHSNLPQLMSQQLILKKGERTQAQGNLLMRHESVCERLPIDNRRVAIRTVVGHRYTLSHALFQHSYYQTHMWRSPHTCALLRFKVGLKSDSIKSSDADSLHVSATITTSTTTNWHSLHLRNDLRYCLAVWCYTKQTQVMSPTSLPTLTSDAWRWLLKFSMSDIPLQLLASANVASNKCALATFSQAEGCLMRNVPSLHSIPSQTGVNPWQFQYPSTYPQGSPAVLRPPETVQWASQRAREGLNPQRDTARRALLFKQGELPAATHQFEAAASQNLIITLTRTKWSTERAHASSATRTWSRRAIFPKTKGTFIAILSGSKSSSSISARIFWWRE